MKGETLGEGQIAVLKEGITSEFLGYQQLDVEGATVVSLLKDEEPVSEMTAGDTGRGLF